MPRSPKYSYLITNNISNKNLPNKIIERMDSNINSPSSPSNTIISCPANSSLGDISLSPNPIEKPCRCNNNPNKWIHVDGAC